MSNRLSIIDAELDKLLQSTDPSLRKEVALVLANTVIATSQLDADSRYSAIEAHDSSKLSALVELLDNEYFHLQELVEADLASQEHMLAAFNKARAANSVFLISTGDYFEAIYEAFSATGDTPEMSHIARRALSSSA